MNELLGAYVLGVLDGDEWAEVRSHLEDCEDCRRETESLRATEAALGAIPAEVFLDGPPLDGDILLQQTLDDVRAESRSHARRRGYTWAGAAVLVAVLAIAGGLLLGRGTHNSTPTVAAGTPSATSLTGISEVSATDPKSGATMSVVLQPAAGWTKLYATVGGIPAGVECRLTVVAHDGSREPTGSWLTGTTQAVVDTAALMRPEDVASIDVENYAGEILVSAPV